MPFKGIVIQNIYYDLLLGKNPVLKKDFFKVEE